LIEIIPQNQHCESHDEYGELNNRRKESYNLANRKFSKSYNLAAFRFEKDDLSSSHKPPTTFAQRNAEPPSLKMS
jgi:hypothetical protein